jgi:endoglucanase
LEAEYFLRGFFMKNRKIAALFMAAVLAAGSFVVPGTGSVQVFASDNIITNGTFDKNVRDWGFWADSDASADISCANQKLQLRIDKTGGENWAVQLYFDRVPMYKNGVYHVSFEIASDKERSADFCGMTEQSRYPGESRSRLPPSKSQEII